MLRLGFFAFLCLFVCSWSHEETMDDKLKSLFKIVEKLLDHDEKLETLSAQLEDAKAIIQTSNMRQTEMSVDDSSNSMKQFAASSYTRWGRSTCPDNASLVYDGFAGGAMYTESGGAVNYICLPKDPDWKNHTETPAALSFVHGGEYETTNSIFNKLHDHEVPCAVCRVPSPHVIMVPGKSACHTNYKLEYKGYLMAGYPTHAAASEYVCVDSEAERSNRSSSFDHNGKLFYFVRAKCGSLKCPPYKEGDDLTCAVCSYYL